MSRKKRPTSPATVAPPNAAAPSSVEPVPVVAPRPAPPPPQPPRPNKWFLAASIAILAAWIGFLLYLALHARHAAG